MQNQDMTVDTFFVCYFLLLLFGGILITGWFAITRGEEKVQPDGSIKQIGKIFKGWYFYWFEKTGTTKIVYRGSQLHILVQNINNIWPGAHANVNRDSRFNTTFYIDPLFVEKADWISDRLGVKFFYGKPRENGKIEVEASKEEDEYKYPEWVRTPIAGCVTCFGSVYGSLVFWVFLLLLTPQQVDYIFDCGNSQWLLIFLTWISYCISLSWFNTWLWKKIS